jgi:hypothetical protein
MMSAMVSFGFKMYTDIPVIKNPAIGGISPALPY